MLTAACVFYAWLLAACIPAPPALRTRQSAALVASLRQACVPRHANACVHYQHMAAAACLIAILCHVRACSPKQIRTKQNRLYTYSGTALSPSQQLVCGSFTIYMP